LATINMKFFSTLRTTLTIGLASVVLTTGCGKSATEEAETAAPAPEATAEAQPNQPTAAPAPTAATPNVYLQQSQTALGAGDYEKAAAALISAQQQANLSAQQAEAVAAQMRQLQSSLASAVAGGDARAKAAADKLRASATVR
jgi:hypothetical protein